LQSSLKKQAAASPRNQLPLTLLGIEAKERSLLTSSAVRDLEVGTRGQSGHKFLELVTLGQ